MEEKQLYNYAIRLLAKRRYHSVELCKKLGKKASGNIKDLKAGDETNKIIDNILTRLRDYKFIDDDEYINLFIQDQLIRKPQGPRLIRQKLLKKGIDSNDIKKYLIISEIIQMDLAKKAIAAKKADLNNPKAKAKIIRFLLSRGFDYQTALQALTLRQQEALEDLSYQAP
jgi:regulatory protein